MATTREHWGSRMGFIMAAAGSAIGLGNLWKFPYITWHNNGGAFVLIYLVCIAAVGLPIMMAEILIGRKTQTSPVGAMKKAVGPAWGWVGAWGVLAGFVILGYYSVVAGWTLSYFVKCLSWTFSGFPADIELGSTFTGFVANGPLQIGLSALFSAATMGVIYFGVGHGIERVTRILMPLLFGILLLLLISALTMSGAGEALTFIFEPRFSHMRWAGVLEALGHAFFTLSLGMGAMITYGSYLSRKDSVVTSSLTVVVLDTLIALFATVIMFSVIFSVPGMKEQVTKSTAGMLFITMPKLFYTVVPMGGILAPLFYVLVAFAALTSTISLLEVVVSYFIDERGTSRVKATTLCGLSTFVLTLFCALSLGASDALSGFEWIHGKQGLFATLDHIASNWQLPIGGFFITLAAGWFMTRKSTEEELADETAPNWFRYGAWRFFIRYIAPLAVASIIAAVIFFHADFS
jgi:NSS family neurotransmitter:Na+ symporter